MRTGRSPTAGRFPPDSIIRPWVPEHAHLKDSGRAEYVGCTDADALAAFALLARSEGILCAFESAHALAHALKMAEEAKEGTVLVVNLSGRGDKDVAQAQGLLSPSA
jgi:tryptophan synthase beta chain